MIEVPPVNAAVLVRILIMVGDHPTALIEPSCPTGTYVSANNGLGIFRWTWKTNVGVRTVLDCLTWMDHPLSCIFAIAASLENVTIIQLQERAPEYHILADQESTTDNKEEDPTTIVVERLANWRLISPTTDEHDHDDPIGIQQSTIWWFSLWRSHATF